MYNVPNVTISVKVRHILAQTSSQSPIMHCKHNKQLHKIKHGILLSFNKKEKLPAHDKISYDKQKLSVQYQAAKKLHFVQAGEVKWCHFTNYISLSLSVSLTHTHTHTHTHEVEHNSNSSLLYWSQLYPLSNTSASHWHHTLYFMTLQKFENYYS